MSEPQENELTDPRELPRELPRDARRTPLEQELCSDMQDRVLIYGADTRISDAQWDVLHRIESKVYA